MEILFSFVVPTFNRGSQILKTVHSIMGGGLNEIEIVIVDDGSTDNTEEVVKSLSDQRINYYKIKNSERGAARNYGLARSHGLYVIFFDSDDILIPCLPKLADFIANHSFPEVVYGQIEHVDAEGNRLFSSGNLPFKSFTKNLLFNNFLACGSVILKRDVAIQFPFNEDRRLSSAEDWELWLRIHTQHEFIPFPQPIFQQVHHEGRSLSKIQAENVEIRDCFFSTIILSSEIFSKKYSENNIRLFVADRYSFIALSWCGISNSNARSFLFRSFKASPFVVSRKRFWAVLKKLLLE